MLYAVGAIDGTRFLIARWSADHDEAMKHHYNSRRFSTPGFHDCSVYA